MKIALIVFNFSLGAMVPNRAGESSASPAATVSAPITDPAQIARHYQQVLARPPFQDTGEPPVDTRVEDWLSRWFREFHSTIGDFRYSSHMPAFESLLMTLLVAFSLGILIYIVLRLTRRGPHEETDLETETPGRKVFHPPEFYEEEIRLAVQARDWHTAWRAAWRQFLSRLESRHLVEADRTRTNREYLAQLRGQTLPATALLLLVGLVDAYDRFVYGRKSIGEPEWKSFHQQLDEAGLLLHLDDKIPGARFKQGGES